MKILSKSEKKALTLRKVFDEPEIESLVALKYDEIHTMNDIHGFGQKFIDGINAGANITECAAKFESHDNFDILHINVPEELADKSSMKIMGVCFYKKIIICVYDLWDEKNDVVLSLIENYISRSMDTKDFSYRRIILGLIDFLTKGDADLLGKIEDDVGTLEEKVISGSGSIQEILDIRSTLQPMKRLYEQLLDTLEDMSDNENDLFSENEVKYCIRLNNRVHRLYNTVLSLRDYVTQVREAYQAQIDIGVNNIMKTFTVITAIFLPLTLLVGWYGMNLMMPEFNWKYGYAAVITLSAVIVVVCLIYFKKKKWF